jgi:hypothetical protein
VRSNGELFSVVICGNRENELSDLAKAVGELLLFLNAICKGVWEGASHYSAKRNIGTVKELSRLFGCASNSARAIAEDKCRLFDKKLASADEILDGRGQTAKIYGRDHKHQIDVYLESASGFSVVRVSNIEAFDLVSRAVKDDGCGIGKLCAATAGGKGYDKDIFLHLLSVEVSEPIKELGVKNRSACGTAQCVVRKTNELVVVNGVLTKTSDCYSHTAVDLAVGIGLRTVILFEISNKLLGSGGKTQYLRLALVFSPSL